MKAIRKEPRKAAEIIDIENTLEALQHEVGGYIETVTLASDCCLIVNEEGRINDLPFNCRLCGLQLFGTILVVGVDGDEFTDLAAAHKTMRLLGWGSDA